MEGKREIVAAWKAELGRSPDKAASMDEGAWYSSAVALGLRLYLARELTLDELNAEFPVGA